MNAIVISLGGLGVGYIGCYGNGWIDTPTLDRLAAEGIVFDRSFSGCPMPVATRRAWWSGRYSRSKQRVQVDILDTPHQSLTRLLQSGGVETILIRDPGSLFDCETPEPGDFDQIISVNRSPGGFGQQVFAAARQWLERKTGDKPYLLFLDCSGAHPPWNPPETQLDHYSDAGEREATDDLRKLQRIYGATISACDQKLGEFLQQLRHSGEWDKSLVMVTSDFGEPLGEHGVVGASQSGLYEELVHVPLIAHLPNAPERAVRCNALIETVDLMPTVLEAMGVPVEPPVDGLSLLPIIRLDRTSLRDCVCMEVPRRAWAIRTPEWHFILPQAAVGESEPSEPELYVKPDDRWERNNLAKQFPGVVEELERILRRFAARNGS